VSAPSLAEDFDPLAPDAAARLNDWFSRGRSETPIFFSEQLGAWVVSRHQDAHEVLTNGEVYSATVSTSPLMPFSTEAMAVLVEGGWKHRSVFSTDAPDHTRFRSLVSRVFTPKRVAKFESFIREQAELAADRLEATGRADVIATVCYPVPGLTILELLGFGGDYLEQIKDGALARILLSTGRLDVDEQVRAAHGLVDSWNFASGLVRSRLDEPRDDLISDLLAVRGGDDSVLTLDEATSMLLTFFSAGHETSTHMLANALLHLLSDRQQWEPLCRQPDLAANAIEETLRYDPPIYSWRRKTRVDTTLAGVNIPAGQIVLVWLGSANRDENLFDGAEDFDLKRADARQHFAFSKGAHYCIGAPLARLEGVVTLEVLSRRFPDLRLVEGAREYIPSGVFHGMTELWVQTSGTE
jgi:cytochrome P450